MKSIVPAVKGTRDFYPPEMARRIWLYDTLRRVSERFGYQEYEAPILEKVDLYAAKSGEELVKEQSFAFQDRSGEWLTLRPELTPSLARMVAQRQNELVYPLRWWSFGPFWRYERPQKGRTREFFQWNIDQLGAEGPEADAELVAICAFFFKEVGLSPAQVQVLVNDRRLMEREIAALQIDILDQKQLFRYVDRQDKLSPEAWNAYGLELGLTETQVTGIRNLLQNKALWRQSPELQRVFAVVEAMGVGDYVSYDSRIIRGLDYYTGTVFEAVDVDGGRSILGGGRYDNLLADVGGDPLTGVGFAMGDVMVTLTLEKYGRLPAFQSGQGGVLVTVFDESRLPAAFGLAAELRASGLKTIVYPEAVKLVKQLKYADRVGLRFAILCGPDEEAAGTLTIKDLALRTQQTAPRHEVPAILKYLLAQA